jgi:rifampin ADP-ribosylating transferase
MLIHSFASTGREFEPLFAALPPSISVPALLPWGDRDHFLPRGDQEAMLDAIPGSRLVVYEGGGHLVLWEAPERVANDLVSFIQQFPVHR